MSFQVIDDVLDVVASSRAARPVAAGHDLVEGVYTLPTLRTLQGPAGGNIADLLGRPLEPEEVDKALAIIRSEGAVAAALTDARAYVDEGRAAFGRVGFVAGRGGHGRGQRRPRRPDRRLRVLTSA